MTENNVNENDYSSVDTKSDGDVKTVDLYDANKGKAPRTGGPYLDDVERRKAEEWRAKREDREPDLDNPPAVVSTVLVPKSQLRETDVDKSHFSDVVELENEPIASYEANTADGFRGDPDPTQPNFDNNMDRVRILEAGDRLQELKEKAGDKAPNAQPDSAPTESYQPLPNAEAQYNQPNVNKDSNSTEDDYK